MRKFIFLVALVFFVFLACAKNQSINFTYSFTEALSAEKAVDFSSLMLKVSTDRESNCRYDENKGISYDNMDGMFDLTYGKLHEKSFAGLGDGVYKYYVKCKDNQSNVGEEMEIVVRVNSLVTGQIVLEEEEPLRDGRYEVTLITSKIVSQAPSLSVSFDGIVYEPVPLIGKEKVWKGHLIIPKNFGEGVISFRFKANDLEGREGSEIVSGGAYLVDTYSPSIITSIKATGYKGEVKLEWDLDEEDIENYRIYRSSSQEVKTTDFYEETEESPFFDKGVEDGKTYYYRVAGVDQAGNEGDLSIEVHSTALLQNGTSSQGLDLQLVGKVDNFLTEVDATEQEVEDIEDSVSLKQEKEKKLYQELELIKEIQNAKSELNLIKKDAERFKLQDLSEEELDRKISSARVRMDIIEKKVPESIAILEEDSVKEDVSEQEIREAILELQPGISERAKERSVKESRRIIQESELGAESIFYVLEINYMDGTKKPVSIVKREISSKLEEIEWSGRGEFIETIPKNLAETASEIEISGANYRIVKEDPVLAFGPDSRTIFYYFEKQASPSLMKEIGFVFVSILGEPESSGITGYFVIQDGVRDYWGVMLGVVVAAVLSIYFVYLKKGKGSEQFMHLKYKIKESKNYLKKGEKEKAVEDYLGIRDLYDKLDKREKSRVYDKIKKLHKKIKEAS
jgi:hypothetical protein